MLSLLRQGLSVEREFGIHSLEALASIAETIEESVYEVGSLTRTSTGLTFRLNNPPLRTGAFSSLRLVIDGVRVPADRARVRVGPGLLGRDLTGISRDRPIELRPGDRIEFAVDGPFPQGAKKFTVRLELQSTAIPPLVWFEFSDTLGENAA